MSYKKKTTIGALRRRHTLTKNVSTATNLNTMIEIVLIVIGKTLKCIITKTQIGKEMKKVEAKVPIKVTHNHTKIEHPKLYLTTIIIKNLA